MGLDWERGGGEEVDSLVVTSRVRTERGEMKLMSGEGDSISSVVTCQERGLRGAGQSGTVVSGTGERGDEK